MNNNVNVTTVYNNVYVNKTTNVANTTYVNQRVNGAVAAVPNDVMVSGRPVAAARVAVPSGAVAAAPIQTAAPVAPQRAAVLGGSAPTTAAPPAAFNSRAMLARTPPPAAPVPFAQQQSALQSNPGQPVGNTALNQMRQQAPQGPAPQRPMIRQVNPQVNPQVNLQRNTIIDPAARVPQSAQPQPQVHQPAQTNTAPQLRRGNEVPHIRSNTPQVRDQTVRPSVPDRLENAQPKGGPVPQIEAQPRGQAPGRREDKGREKGREDKGREEKGDGKQR